ncbi:MAG: VWA domain-containing protein [Pyrinomonadaceae bacterium]
MIERRLFTTAILLAAGAMANHAQSPTPSPPVDNDVVKIQTNLIQIDVSVTDSKGRVVTDLKPSEIEIYENGQKQKITAFSFVSSTRTAAEKTIADPLGLPPPPTTLRAENVRRSLALVVDDLTLSFESVYYTRRAVKKFIDEQMQPGDLVAIVRTGAGTGALQQFTADKRLLYAAIEKIKWNPVGSGGIGTFAPIDDSPTASDEREALLDPDGAPADLSGRIEDFRSTMSSTGALGALRYVATGMSELPGRKSVILFSHGFKLFGESGGSVESDLALDYMRVLVDHANRASVTFYTIDPRGLVYTGMTAADRPGSALAGIQATAARSRLLRDTQEGLQYLARETGGLAMINSNDLGAGVRRVLDDQSYYLIAYEPDSETFDPAKRRYNKLDIKVLRKDASARHRSGFINVAEREKRPATATPTADPAMQLQNALVSPFAVNGIDLRLNALFGSDLRQGAYVRSLLHVDGGDLTFTDAPDGQKKTSFDIFAASFSDTGQVVDQFYKTYTLTLKPPAYSDMRARGFIYNFVFPVKTPGAFQYRVAIRDTGTGALGSASQFIEVPNLKKSRLTLSSIILESITAADWDAAATPNGKPFSSDPMTDTALRRLKSGTVVRYGAEIYNPKLDGAQQPKLTTKIRIFRDGKLILDGASRAQAASQPGAPPRIVGAFTLGKDMQPGDYVLQVIAIDTLANKKQQIATQFIQFEVVD